MVRVEAEVEARVLVQPEVEPRSELARDRTDDPVAPAQDVDLEPRPPLEERLEEAQEVVGQGSAPGVPAQPDAAVEVPSQEDDLMARALERRSERGEEHLPVDQERRAVCACDPPARLGRAEQGSGGARASATGQPTGVLRNAEDPSCVPISSPGGMPFHGVSVARMLR